MRRAGQRGAPPLNCGVIRPENLDTYSRTSELAGSGCRRCDRTHIFEQRGIQRVDFGRSSQRLPGSLGSSFTSSCVLRRRRSARSSRGLPQHSSLSAPWRANGLLWNSGAASSRCRRREGVLCGGRVLGPWWFLGVRGVQMYYVASGPYNKQLERTVIRRRVRAACASLHYAHAARWTRGHAAAQLRRYTPVIRCVRNV